MSCAQRLKRVFDIDIQICEHCGRAVWIIASIKDPAIIKTLVEPLEKTATPMPIRRALPTARAPSLSRQPRLMD